MAGTNYTGDPTAAESPSPAPALGLAPIAVIPDDGDALSAASVAQAFKTLADFVAFGTIVGMARLSGDLFVNDNFVGSALSAGIWGSSPDAAFTPGPATGTNGIVTGTHNSNAVSSLTTNQFDLGTRDFALTSRCKLTSMGGSTSQVLIDLYDGSSNHIGFDAVSGTTNWQFIAGDLGSPIDTGVPAIAGVYQVLKFTRIAGVLTAYINGTQVATAAYASAVYSYLHLSVARETSGTTTLLIDYVNLWGASL